MRSLSIIIPLSVIVLSFLPNFTQGVIPAYNADSLVEGSTSNSKLQREETETALNKLSSNDKGVLYQYLADDREFSTLEQVPFKKAYSVCAPEGSTSIESSDFKKTWVRVHSDYGMLECVMDCLKTSEGSACSIAKFATLPEEDKELKVCVRETCEGVLRTVPGLNAIEKSTRDVELWVASNQIEPSTAPSPMVSVIPTPSAFVNPNPSPEETDVFGSATPSPIRTDLDFVIQGSKDPVENSLAVATIVEVYIEQQLDKRANITGNDVKTQTDIIQKKINNDFLKSFRNSGAKALLPVARPLADCLPSRNCVVRVIVTSPKKVRRVIVEKAILQVRNRKGFGDVFKVNGFQIKKRAKGKKYIVLVSFQKVYLDKFI